MGESMLGLRALVMVLLRPVRMVLVMGEEKGEMLGLTLGLPPGLVCMCAIAPPCSMIRRGAVEMGDPQSSPML